MRKIIITILISACCICNNFAQETYANKTNRHLLDQGIELHKQKKYAVSSERLKKFISTTSLLEKQLLQEANYYIVCNAYEARNKEAMDILNSYSQIYPYSPMISRVYFMLGKLYYDKKEYAETLKYYKKIKNSDLKIEENNEYLYSRGYSHLVMKEYKQASFYFSSLAGKNQPYEIDATYYFAYSEFCLKNYDTALKAFKKIPERSKYFEPTSFHILQIYDRKNDHKNAIAQGENLLSKFKSSKYNSEAYRILGESSYRNKQWNDAVNYLKKYVQHEKKVQRSNLYMLGYSYFQTKSFSNAIKSLGRVTSENDLIAQNAYLYIAYSNLEIKDIKKAQMAFQAASLMNFDKDLKEEAAYNYALAAYQGNSPFGETLAAFERFINEYPNSDHHDEIYNYLASVYMNEKDYISALNSINKINTKNAKIRQAKENALFQIGANFFINENYDDALKYFNLSIKEYTPKSFSAQAFLWRGETYYQLNDKTKAINDIVTYLAKTQDKLIGNKIKAYYTLGYCAFEDKNYNEAAKWFNNLTEIKGADRNRLYTDVLNRLADCHYNNRDFEAARKAYAKVNPRSPVADYANYQNAFILGIQKQYSKKIEILENLIETYRNSSYIDDAIYEIGRTYVVTENYDKAIQYYSSLQKKFPKSALTRKAGLEIGMLYANMNKTNQAISAFKHVIETYPSSQETRVALESLQSLYIEINKVEDYLAYRESIAGTTISDVPKSQEDSLSFLAAERVYAKEDYNGAIESLNTYIVKYCDIPTLNCISATFYLAESYYALNQKDDALKFYDKVINKDGNSYMEISLLKGAEIAYDKELYSQANEYFMLLEETAQLAENLAVAKLGQLRCNFKTNQHQATINIANSIIKNSTGNEHYKREARYCRAKALIASNRTEDAIDDLIFLSENIQYEMGAEAMILHANYLYEQTKYEQAEKLITNFIEQNSPHQYWIARSFILLADINIAKKDDFMAKQYLMSLSENYPKKDDDIAQMIKERLDGIMDRESETVI